MKLSDIWLPYCHAILGKQLSDKVSQVTPYGLSFIYKAKKKIVMLPSPDQNLKIDLHILWSFLHL